MRKNEVYSWRVSALLKAELEVAARAARKSMAALLEEIVKDWLERSKGRGQDDDEDERLRAAAMKFVGTIQSGQSHRAENARSKVRSRLAGTSLGRLPEGRD